MYKLKLEITGNQADLLHGLNTVSGKVRNPRKTLTKGESRALKKQIQQSLLDNDFEGLKALMEQHDLFMSYCDKCGDNAPVLTTSKGSCCCVCSHPINTDLEQTYSDTKINLQVYPITD